MIATFGQVFWRLTIIFSLEAIVDDCRASYFYSANKKRIIIEEEFVEADAEGTVNGLLQIECEVRQRGKLHTGSFSIGTI
jgi:hypothetical protein